MKKRLVLAILVAVLSVILLAACSGDKTADATPDTTPTATPNPLLNMDEVDRAILLYDRYDKAEVSSYKVGQDSKLVVEMNGQQNTITNVSQGIVYDLYGDNYVSYWVGETTTNGEKETIKQGFINGYEFIIADNGAKIKSKISMEDYLNNLAIEDEKLDDGLKICLENCSTITSYQNTSGNWVIEAKDYTVDASRKVFEALFGKMADAYGFAVASISVDYMIVLSEDGIPTRTYIKITTTPYAEYDLKMTMTYDSAFTDVDAVAEAPKVDISDAIEVPDVDVFDDITENVREIVNAESATSTVESTVIVTGDFLYYLKEIDKIAYSFADGMYKLDIDLNMETGLNPNDAQKITGFVKYDGEKLMYNIGGQESSTVAYMDAAKAVVSNMYLSALPITSNISGYTVSENNGVRQFLFHGNQAVYDEALVTLYSLTGVKWIAKDSKATFMVEMDTEGNVLYIRQYIKVAATLSTYNTEIEIINIIDLTK